MAKRFRLLPVLIFLLLSSLALFDSVGTAVSPWPVGPAGPVDNSTSGPLINSSITTSTTKDSNKVIIETITQLAVFTYACLAIALICDEYFVPSIEQIGESLSLSTDIIGTILIPLGTSGPEIFLSAISVLLTQDDIGIGGVIGSAVFNLLAIPAACGLAVAFFIRKPIELESRSLLRDLVFYIITVIVLILAIRRNEVDLIESSMMVILGVIYISVMVYWAFDSQQLPKSCCKCLESCVESKTRVNNNKDVAVVKNKDVVDSERTPLLKPQNLNHFTESMNKNNQKSILIISELQDIESNKQELKRSDAEEDDGLISNCYLQLLMLPMTLLFRLTMPKKCASITFWFAILWLGLLSYCTIWSITGVSDTFEIPHTITGMTLLSAGSAIPDLITSIIVIRKNGLATMGISAAIASNTFAIVIGLGIPWLLQCAITWCTTGQFHVAVIIIESASLQWTFILMLLVILLFLCILKFISSWRIYWQFSLICFILYVLFLSVSIALEFLLKK